MANVIGNLKVQLGLNSAGFNSGFKSAERQAATSSANIQRSMKAVVASAAAMGVGLSVGAFASLAKEALDYAGGLGELAMQTGLMLVR